MIKQPVAIVVAYGKNREIGRKGRLIWHISDDLKRFKKITMGGTLIMGRKTFDSIGKPLPGRKNIVLTRNKKWNAKGVFVKNYPSQAMNLAQCLQRPVYIIGGEEIYKQYLPLTDLIYATEIDAEAPDADAYFPDIDKNSWEKIAEENWQSDPTTKIRYRYVTYKRKK